MVRTTGSQRLKLDFALSEQNRRQMMQLLFGPDHQRPQDPERGCLATLYAGSGRYRRTLILGEIIAPRPGEVYWSQDRGLIMTHGYYSRALDHVQKIPGAGILNIHSHPGPDRSAVPPAPSKIDLESDRFELGAISMALPVGRVVASAIVSPSGGLSVREYKFSRPSTASQAIKFSRMGPNVRFVDRIRIVGSTIAFQQGNPESNKHVRLFDPGCTQSSILLWGECGQQMLSEISIGIAGLGGVGGIVAESLARLGVGHLVMVDYDRLKLENFNRSQGARRVEAIRESPKVTVYSRVARSASTAPNFRVSSHQESAAEEKGIRALLDCDIIIGCADDPLARQVIDHAAYAHLIPVIDGGSLFVSKSPSCTGLIGKSQVASCGPGQPCLECQGVYTQEEATIAREEPSWGEYIDTPGDGLDFSRELRSPSVICSNSLVASLIVFRVLSIVLGTTPNNASGLQRYYVETGELHWGAIKSCKPGCAKNSFTGLGDSHALPTAKDLRWAAIRNAVVEFAAGGQGGPRRGNASRLASGPKQEIN